MHKLLPIFFLISTTAIAAPTSTTTHTQNGEGIIERPTHIYSSHHFHVYNNTNARKVYPTKMTLCPVGKDDQCEIFHYNIGVDAYKEADFDRILQRSVIWRTTGEKSIVATSAINGVVLSQDQKYVWIHY